MKLIRCPLCGFEFSDEMKENACAKCPLHKDCEDCNVICCPNCKYQFVTESKTVSFFKSTFDKIVKKGADDE